jgi:hypothetical protein
MILQKQSLGQGMMIYTSNPSYSGGGDGIIEVRGWPGQKLNILSGKQTNSKRTGGMAQVAELA